MRTHGMTKHPAFAVWRSMLDRCRLPTHQSWHNYGGRGITVCARWRNSFEDFWADMGLTYAPGLELERLHNDGNYEPNNCAWKTRVQQSRNRRTNVEIDTPAGRMLLCQAADLSGIGKTTLCYRVKHSWPAERLFDKPNFWNRPNK